MEVVIVVPTRNRAELASTTAESAVTGGDPRSRVLVSDNSTDAGEAALLRSRCDQLAAGGPLRYVRPPAPMPMSEHWQWAFDQALESPSVTHVMCLTDRLVLRPGALPELLGLAARYPDEVITYGDYTVMDYQRPITIFQRPWTGRLLRVDSEQMLRALARGILIGAPTMLNTLVPRRVMDDIRATYGNVFDSIAPDHCFNYRCLDRVDSILHWDRVVVVQRALGDSNGFSQIRGVSNAAHEDFLRELGRRRINQDAPVPELLTVTNASYNEYEFVRKDPASVKLGPLRRHFYLGANARDVRRLEDPELRAQMERVLAEHGWSGWTRLRYTVGLFASAGGYFLRRPLALLRRLAGRGAAPSPEFSDPGEALSHALAHQTPPRRVPDHLWPLMSRPRATRELSVS